jgi:hypothetical protein
MVGEKPPRSRTGSGIQRPQEHRDFFNYEKLSEVFFLKND